MVVLKLLAWNDRLFSDKHATDVLLILKNYNQAGQHERLYDEAVDLLEAYDYDIELSGAALLGRDAKRDIGQEAINQVISVFEDERKYERFNAQIMRYHVSNPEGATRLFDAFLHEIKK